MDLSQSAPVDFTPPTQFPETNNYMSMGSFVPPCEHPSGEINVDGLENYRDMQLKNNLDLFWNEQIQNIQNITDSKVKNELPVARIKRVMKSNENVKMIRAETPVLFSKACEFLISELTLRAWHEAEDAHRRTIHSCDIAIAIRKDDSLGFLVKTVLLDDHLKVDDDEKSSEASYLVNPLLFPVPESNPGFVFNGLEAPQPMMMPQTPPQPMMMPPTPSQPMMMPPTLQQPMMTSSPQSMMMTPTSGTPSNYGAPAEGFVLNCSEAQQSMMMPPTLCTSFNHALPAKVMRLNESNQGQVTRW